jgi:hypothetical protein
MRFWIIPVIIIVAITAIQTATKTIPTNPDPFIALLLNEENNNCTNCGAN